MKLKNKYEKFGKISSNKFREFLRLFALDLTASQIAKITNLNRNTVNAYTNAVRMRLVEECEKSAPLFGDIEVDESWFGGRRHGKRGRGASGKKIVFGVLKRGGSVYTKIVDNCKKDTLQQIIKDKVVVQSNVMSDEWRAYRGLEILGYTHKTVKHGKGEYASEDCHINGLEGFWGMTKVRLAKFRGIKKNNLFLHLKESDFRFNNRNKNLYKILLRLFKTKPIF